jgi:hypothetical protein
VVSVRLVTTHMLVTLDDYGFSRQAFLGFVAACRVCLTCHAWHIWVNTLLTNPLLRCTGAHVSAVIVIQCSCYCYTMLIFTGMHTPDTSLVWQGYTVCIAASSTLTVLERLHACGAILF